MAAAMQPLPPARPAQRPHATEPQHSKAKKAAAAAMVSAADGAAVAVAAVANAALSVPANGPSARLLASARHVKDGKAAAASAVIDAVGVIAPSAHRAPMLLKTERLRPKRRGLEPITLRRTKRVTRAKHANPARAGVSAASAAVVAAVSVASAPSATTTRQPTTAQPWLLPAPQQPQRLRWRKVWLAMKLQSKPQPSATKPKASAVSAARATALVVTGASAVSVVNAAVPTILFKPNLPSKIRLRPPPNLSNLLWIQEQLPRLRL